MTVKNDFYLTKEGVQTLKDELNTLITVQRPKLAERLKLAIESGDLKENAQYDAARDEQGFTEGRIAEIEHILKHSSIIEGPKGGKIGLGSTVHVELETGSAKYTIVGSTEANPDEGKISNESLIGKALLGRIRGEEVEIVVPAGTMKYKITHVE
jgi:transcription elongation factor GreA